MQRTRVVIYLASALVARVDASAQAIGTFHPIGSVTATSRDTFGSIAGIRQLPNGQLLVNDVVRRRLVLLTDALASGGVVADSTGTTTRAYGPQPGALLRYLGDSSVFVDPIGLSMLVIDPHGRPVRLIALPRPRDAAAVVSRASGVAAVDPHGRLVYALPATAGGIARRQGGGAAVIAAGDSVPILRVDLLTRRVDTVSTVRVAAPKMVMVPSKEGRFAARSVLDPLPIVDGWALLDDGTIAVVRGDDYHVDVVAATGLARRAPKIPFDWQPLSPAAKIAVIDTFSRSFADPSGSSPVGATAARPSFVEPEQLPDYRPPFRPGAVRADREGNLWVLTTAAASASAGHLYDVIDSSGQWRDRVLVPSGRILIGFGPNGVVYLAAVAGRSGYVIERRLRK